MRPQCPKCKRTFIHATGCPVEDDRPHRPAGGWTSPAAQPQTKEGAPAPKEGTDGR